MRQFMCARGATALTGVACAAALVAAPPTARAATTVTVPFASATAALQYSLAAAGGACLTPSTPAPTPVPIGSTPAPVLPCPAVTNDAVDATVDGATVKGGVAADAGAGSVTFGAVAALAGQQATGAAIAERARLSKAWLEPTLTGQVQATVSVVAPELEHLSAAPGDSAKAHLAVEFRAMGGDARFEETVTLSCPATASAPCGASQERRVIDGRNATAAPTTGGTLVTFTVPGTLGRRATVFRFAVRADVMATGISGIDNAVRAPLLAPGGGAITFSPGAVAITQSQ